MGMTRLESIKNYFSSRKHEGESSLLAYQECMSRLRTYEEKRAFEYYVEEIDRKTKKTS